MTYLTSPDQAKIVAAQNKISSNCRFPNASGTLQWALLRQSIDGSIWFILKPPIDGYNLREFTQAQMMAGVDMTNITEQECNANWFPPPEAP